MLKFVLFLCVLQLGAADLTGEGKDFEEGVARYQALPVLQDLEKKVSDAEANEAYYALAFGLAKAALQKVLENEREIERDAAADGDYSALIEWKGKYYACVAQAALHENNYARARLERISAENNLQEFFSKEGL